MNKNLKIIRQKEQTFSGYTYIIDGKVVVNKELMPNETDYTYNYSTGKNTIPMISGDYEQALAKWESENIEVENDKGWIKDDWQPKSEFEKPWGMWAIDVNGKAIKVFAGLLCTCKISGEKATITELK